MAASAKTIPDQALTLPAIERAALVGAFGSGEPTALDADQIFDEPG